MRSPGSYRAGQGFTVTKLTESERNKTLHLDDELHRRVVGQDESSDEGNGSDHPFQSEIKDSTKPIGSFLFLAELRVSAKLELAKALAASLFDDENNMVRIDMSEYIGEIFRVPSDRSASRIRRI